MPGDQDAAWLRAFPVLIPGESYYSLLARYHRLSGNLAEQYTFRELFGNRPALNAAVTLPYRVRLIDGKLPPESRLSSELSLMSSVRNTQLFQHFPLSPYRYNPCSWQDLRIYPEAA